VNVSAARRGMIAAVTESITEPVLVMYAPYLPLRSRAGRELADNFGLVGAFAYRVGVGIGGSFDGGDVLDMHRALVVMALDGNPSTFRPEEERTGNEAMSALTSDNALVYGHRIDADGYVAAEYGAMIRTLSGGYNVLADRGKPPMRIRPPADLWTPLMRPHLDGELADAVHRVITANTDEGRRVHRAIGWLDLAWRNAASITLDMRIPAIRSGFEGLFGIGKTRELRRVLSQLLDTPDAPRAKRKWREQDRELEDKLTELEWWFVCFTLLRNAIAHGDALEPTNYDYGEHTHLDIGEYRLRQAIKATVIASGYSELELDPNARALYRALRAHGLTPPEGS
jgi:hypothetical protein